MSEVSRKSDVPFEFHKPSFTLIAIQSHLDLFVKYYLTKTNTHIILVFMQEHYDLVAKVLDSFRCPDRIEIAIEVMTSGYKHGSFLKKNIREVLPMSKADEDKLMRALFDSKSVYPRGDRRYWLTANGRAYLLTYLRKIQNKSCVS
jgi:hypothetical protein